MEKRKRRILVVDDDELVRNSLACGLRSEGFEVLAAPDGKTSLKILGFEDVDVVLADLRMPGMDGMELLRKAKELNPDLPVIIITGYADVEGAVEAMKAGAHDFLAKPVKIAELIEIVRRALSYRDIRRKPAESDNTLSLGKLMGPSDVVGRLIAQVARVAKSEFTVILTGETGSGKELVARAIHQASHRTSGPFVAIDCGAILATLLESELFGHEKGSFTGAIGRTDGKFVMAKGGTLFLDEITNMTPDSQAKLLRVLEEKRIYRVGSSKPLRIDVRLLVAGNRRIEDAVAAGLFREDLLYRLNEFAITVPPIRDRKEDIPYLAERFLESTRTELGKNVIGFSDSAVEALVAYDWPGNVRQLRSTVRRAVLLADEMITPDHLDIKEVSGVTGALPAFSEPVPSEEPSLKDIVRRHTRELERQVLESTLERTGGNKARAARLLHIDYKTIHTKVKELGISTGGEDHEKKGSKEKQRGSRTGRNLEGSDGPA